MKPRMRKEEFLQNYTASQFRVALSGKESNALFITDEMRHKEWWKEVFLNAIEDLEAGATINGKATKNDVAYWQEQLRLLEEFEPR